ncbi:MAG: ferredoxin family protein [Desulfatiglans sp.]|jgi:2-oxoglutarate ferredoxin oxidoreductase subunit delta|nr:ferredoxin family protein [Desulfatiglans sp.]
MKFLGEPYDTDVIKIAKGRVVIIEERCKGCGYCIEFCPRSVLAFSKGFNKKGYHLPVAQNPNECVNCHYCEIICPEFAIFSEVHTISKL